MSSCVVAPGRESRFQPRLRVPAVIRWLVERQIARVSGAVVSGEQEMSLCALDWETNQAAGREKKDPDF